MDMVGRWQAKHKERRKLRAEHAYAWDLLTEKAASDFTVYYGPGLSIKPTEITHPWTLFCS